MKVIDGWKVEKVKIASHLLTPEKQYSAGEPCVTVFYSPGSQGDPGVYKLADFYVGCSSRTTDIRNSEEAKNAARIRKEKQKQPALSSHILALEKENMPIRAKQIKKVSKSMPKRQLFAIENRKIDRAMEKGLPLVNQVLPQGSRYIKGKDSRKQRAFYPYYFVQKK